MTQKKHPIYEQLEKRILILDGAMGTMIQAYHLGENDYRGRQFSGHVCDLKGNNDLLSVTQPHVIEAIHRAYLEAGADIIETNTFNANSISMQEYKMPEQAYATNVAAAQIARKVCDEFTKANPDKPRFVAGSIGPTTRTASMSSDVTDPGARSVTFDELVAAFYEQIRGLVDGGADLLLFETVTDTLNVKAGL
jgi:5-methyltetrahydrofolate--homocysteine methyltransferase